MKVPSFLSSLFPPRGDRSWRYWIVLIGLMTAGWLGNYFHLPLFFGVDFLFGSIAVMLILSLYGLEMGVLAAIVAGSYTYTLWGHPWAWLIVVLEAIVVGLGLKRGFNNILLLDLAYWVPIGMGLVWFFYGQVLGVPPDTTIVTVLKQSLNGIFNALIASLISNILSLSFQQLPQRQSPLQQVVFTLLAFFTMTPLLIITIVTGSQNLQDLESQAWNRLQEAGSTIQAEIQIWYQYNTSTLESLAHNFAPLIDQLPDNPTPLNIKETSALTEALTHYLETAQSVLPEVSQLYMTDANGTIVTIVSQTDKPEQLLHTSVIYDPLWQQIKTQQQTVLSDVIHNTDDHRLELGIATPIVKNRTFQGMLYSSFNLNTLNEILERETTDNLEAAIFNNQRDIIAKGLNYENLDLKTGEKIGSRGDGFHWLPIVHGKPIMTRWRKSFYIQDFSIAMNPHWSLQIKIKATPYIDRLQDLYIRSLSLLLAVLVLALPLVAFFAYRLTKPILNLAQVSTDLPSRIKDNQSITWPQTEVRELSLLTSNFKTMLATLKAQFEAIENAKNQLEKRVLERTAALQESEERFRQFAEHIDSVFWMTDPLKNSMLYVSPAYETLWGKSLDTLYKDPLDFVRSIVDPHRQRVIESFPKQPLGQYDEEYQIQHPSGKRYWIHDRAFPILNDRGEVYRVVGIAEDITQRKETEQEMAAAKRAADAASRAKSEFLATMSHELRTPMNAVIGMTEVLLDTTLNSQQQQFLEIIHSSGEALLALITDILDFSRIEADRIDLAYRPFSLRDVLEESLAIVALKATDKKLEIAYCMAEDCPDWIQEDVDRLRQVLVNLLGNAVKFTAKGHVILRSEVLPSEGITNTLHSLPVTAETDAPSWIRITVEDTGIGIAEDKLDRLFKPFSQVDGSNTRSYGGTGLGLAICRRLVELMGGTIGVDTQPGIGSQFYIILPVRAAAMPSLIPHPTPEEIASLAQKRVLVLSPSPLTGEMLQLQLQSLKVIPTIVTNEAAALEELQATPFAAALLHGYSPAILTHWQGVFLKTSQNAGYSLPLMFLVSPGQNQEEMNTLCTTSNCLIVPAKRSKLVQLLIETLGAETQTPASILAPKSSLRILLAEDDRTNQRVAIEMLDRLGYSAQVVSNGLEVLVALRDRTYDVVLMDLHMPGLDGLQTAQEIHHTFSPEQRPWLIAMTADVTPGIEEACQAAGLQDYISKPIQMETLKTVLSRIPVAT